MLYYKYSDFLLKKYGAKTYKLSVNLPVSCPNRDGVLARGGCSFCAPEGAGFECEPAYISVPEQIRISKEKILKKHKAEKFIAYFQNYSNTYMPYDKFQQYMWQAANTEVCELAVSTRPDVLTDRHILFLKETAETYNKEITVELGLQTANYHTLLNVNRGHTLAEYIDAAKRLKKLFPAAMLCTHVIINLPGDDIIDNIETAKIISVMETDFVKLHALYLVENTAMAEEYKQGKFEIISAEEYIERSICFLEHISPNIAVQRLIGRAPQAQSVFMNWNMSWHRIVNEIEAKMQAEGRHQGSKCNYKGGREYIK